MKVREKIRYEISPDNRLIIRRGDIAGYRKILDGRFTTDKGNNLIYCLTSPPAGEDDGIPPQIKFAGRWSLDKNHDLRLTFDRKDRAKKTEELTLSGEIIAAEENKLVFALATRDEGGRQSIYLLKLGGRFRADGKNRLNFQAKRIRPPDDTLVFDGIWELGRNHEIVYRYQKRYLRRLRAKSEKTIIFRGFWDIQDKRRLFYSLDRDGKSGFEFKGSFGSPSITGKKGEIRFRLGAGASRRTLTFFGRWKLGEKLGLSFELEPSRGRARKILFSTSYRINREGEIEFALSNRRGKMLAMSVTLKKRFFKDLQSYLRLRKMGEERAIEVGAVRRF